MPRFNASRLAAGPPSLSVIVARIGYVSAFVICLSVLPAIGLGASDAAIRIPGILVGVGVASIALLLLSSPALFALRFSPPTPLFAPDNPLAASLRWLGRAAWSGVLFAFAAVFGATVGVTASSISNLGQQYDSCLANPASFANCTSITTAVRKAGGISNLYVTQLERGTFVPIVIAILGVAIVLVGVRLTLTLRILNRTNETGRAIFRARDHSQRSGGRWLTEGRARSATAWTLRRGVPLLFWTGISGAFLVVLILRAMLAMA